MNIADVQGVIFDVDDTILNNRVGDDGRNIHEMSRHQDVMELAQKYNISELKELSIEDDLVAFNTALTHTSDGAIWNLFYMKGLVPSKEVDYTHLWLQEASRRKHEIHEIILRQKGVPIEGAVEFIASLRAHGLEGRLALATTGIRRDIDIFLSLAGLDDVFSDDKIKTRESVVHTKPHPEVFHKAFDSLGLSRDARRFVLAFEDDPRGIASARKAGLFVCAITTRYDKTQLASLVTPPHYIADGYNEFAQFLGM